MKNTIILLFILFVAIDGYSQIFEEGVHIPGDFPTSAAFGDLNGDGHVDFLQTFAQNPAPDSLNATKIWINNGDNTFTLNGDFGNTSNKDIKIADIDNDGDLDAITASRIWLNDGSANFSIGRVLGIDVYSVVVADFNEDGYLDVFCAVYDRGTDDRLFLSDGNGELIYTLFPWTTGSYSTDAQTVDINNDGHMDIIIAKGQSPLLDRRKNEVWLGNGDGSFYKSPQGLPKTACYSMVAGDYNNDGFVDLIFLEPYGVVRGYLNDGTSFFQASTNLFTGVSTTDIQLADIDNDGYLDLIIARFGDNPENFSSTVLLNDTNGSFTAGSEDFSVANTFQIQPVDIDQDNDIDLFTINVNNQDCIFWMNQTDPVISVEENDFLSVTLYPNPSTNFIFLNVHQTITKIEVFDILGKRILKLDSYNSQKGIDISLLENGIYICRIITENQISQVIRFIKE